MYFMYMTVSVSMVASDQTLCVMVTATLLTLSTRGSLLFSIIVALKLILSGTLPLWVATMIKKT